MSLIVLNPDGSVFGKTIPLPFAPKIEPLPAITPDATERRGFNDVLRDSTESQQPAARTESPEPIDAQPRAETEQDDPSVADQPEPVEQDTQATDTNQDATDDSSESEVASQGSEQQGSEASGEAGEETSDAAQLQAAANAASAQLNVVEAVVNSQPKTQAQASTTQQFDINQVAQATSNGQSATDQQSAGSNVSLTAALTNQAQSTNGQASQATATVVDQPTLQPGAQSQTNSGDTGGDNKGLAASSTATTATSSNNNAAAATAFTVPDQATGESRLPINTTTTAQSADAARLAQAQSATPASDNDSLNTARLTRGLANAVQQRGGAVTLRLTPPEMGTVRIQMQITGTNVSASFHAESASAQTLLTTQLAQLRTALESKGMSVERLSVQPLAATAQSNNANQSQNQNDAQQQSQSQQQSAGDGRSRGQYRGDSSGQQSPDQQDNGSGQARRGFFDRLNDASEDEAA